MPLRWLFKQKEFYMEFEKEQEKAIVPSKVKLWKKGQSGNPAGRKKGSGTTKATLIKNFTDVMLAGGSNKFRRELMKLKGRAYVDSYLCLLEYSLPKKARVEVTGEDGDTIKVKQVFMIGTTEIIL